MRKTIGIFIILLFSAPLLAREYSLDELLNVSSEKGVYKKIENIENSKLVLEQRGLFVDRWLKFKFLLNSNNIYYPEGNFLTNSNTSNLELYYTLLNSAFYGQRKDFIAGSSNAQVYYNFLYYDYSLDYANNGKPDFRQRKVGVFKDLNDFYYSEDRFKRKQYFIRKDLVRNTNGQAKENAQKDIVDLYVKVLNIHLEKEIKKEAVQDNNKQLELLKARTQDSTPFDIEYIELQNQEYENDLQDLTEDEKIQTMKLLEKAGIAPEDKEQEDISLKELVDITTAAWHLYPYSVEAKDIEIRRQKEYIRYTALSSMISKTIYADYDPENLVWTARASIGLYLYDYGADKKIQKKNLEKLELEKAELEKNHERNLKLAENEYERLQKKYATASARKEIFEKRELVARGMFDRGYMSMLDYHKEKQSRIDAILSYNKIKNELNGFKYKYLQ
ncbi:MAG: hypothetical protein A3J83_06165 [Elusimicrobia bacterium RIFOXYA2_FULL_40_6]|nr:MAG: hypothetical protein A3J83_06165 [Elusimicrobia bacterium RIFOXYA2_FULL_40_6]